MLTVRSHFVFQVINIGSSGLSAKNAPRAILVLLVTSQSWLHHYRQRLGTLLGVNGIEIVVAPIIVSLTHLLDSSGDNLAGAFGFREALVPKKRPVCLIELPPKHPYQKARKRYFPFQHYRKVITSRRVLSNFPWKIRGWNRRYHVQIDRRECKVRAL